MTTEIAHLLRMAREEIQRAPRSFNIVVWECGTTACIGGHMIRADCRERGLPLDEPRLSPAWLTREDPQLCCLFYDFSRDTPERAVAAINAYLIRFGEPLEEAVGELALA